MASPLRTKESETAPRITGISQILLHTSIPNPRYPSYSRYLRSNSSVKIGVRQSSLSRRAMFLIVAVICTPHYCARRKSVTTCHVDRSGDISHYCRTKRETENKY